MKTINFNFNSPKLLKYTNWGIWVGLFVGVCNVIWVESNLISLASDIAFYGCLLYCMTFPSSDSDVYKNSYALFTVESRWALIAYASLWVMFINSIVKYFVNSWHDSWGFAIDGTCVVILFIVCAIIFYQRGNE